MKSIHALMVGALIGIPLFPVYSAPAKGTLLFGATTVAAISWGCLNYYKKLKLEEYFEQLYADHKASTVKLQEHITRLQNESDQLEKDQHFLASIKKYIDTLEQDYGCELALVANSSAATEATEALSSTIKNRITRSGLQYGSLETILHDEQNKIADYKRQLEVKMLEWSSKEKREPYVTQGQKIVAHLDALSSFFTTFLLTTLKQANFIKLELLLDKEYKDSYAFEYGLVSEDPGQSMYEQKLDRHIRAKYSNVQYQFPYIQYAEQLNKELTDLKHILHELKDCKPLAFQNEHLEEAYKREAILKEILAFIVTTKAYNEEKQRKPQFDFQVEQQKLELQERQERLLLEKYEKQIHIEEEKKEGERKLQKELNKSQELANQKAEITRSIKELELKEREIEFEWEKLKEGQKFKELLENNDAQWEQRCRKLYLELDEVMQKRTALQAQLNEIRMQTAQSLQSLEATLTDEDKEGAHGYIEKIQASLAPLRALVIT